MNIQDIGTHLSKCRRCTRRRRSRIDIVGRKKSCEVGEKWRSENEKVNFLFFASEM